MNAITALQLSLFGRKLQQALLISITEIGWIFLCIRHVHILIQAWEHFKLDTTDILENVFFFFRILLLLLVLIAFLHRSVTTVTTFRSSLRIRSFFLFLLLFHHLLHLMLDGIAFPQRHRHKLSNIAIPAIDTVEPQLFGDRAIVLLLLGRAQRFTLPCLACHRIDFSDANLDRARPRRTETDPHRFALPHWHNTAFALLPFGGHAIARRIVLHFHHLKLAERRWQRICLIVVWNTQCALKLNPCIANVQRSAVVLERHRQSAFETHLTFDWL
mmetsp:Transcript_36054/g.59199  ORF Transcript_36054/g.59199 Transcript_36054/m.59199 type:complete len:273 (-) Transcript_36054:406-1224(-)